MRQRFVSLRWEPRDHHRWATALALVGLTIAAAMALFGLPPVDLHPPMHHLGIMDPLCGGTRAARYTAQGRLVEAWRYNPLGILTVAGGVVAAARAGLGGAAGRWATLHLDWTPRRKRIAIAVVVVLVAALEIRQQLHAALLTAGT